ncbi:exocyst complex component EXO70B1 [Ricinus communis]|uniref:Exocyst subunit Exo70 family protein n=1 Tax=Ricinus communis TaxID=3988 RepID=B9SF67_RICCO|nr:exocyst complex component EXO70B1 [Ricinus communis]XP_015578140.1 exocyst complex component EXO70B1 [Ricinus communis]XP_015578141.1 exocyst complex component EXO70B1 [Ricinus communis]XP_015578142.1 exocyst complex component EXO70B1 [Ricinus communis]XP_015578143.1 exocyst complex component EXO70B1 [Ricinus communis]EEF37746.1 protein binding protein, putative [Ricinus communis]|eukprot:XP_002524636.1 exocyst complex component EXO70B1 [Ricinus communis]
MEENGEEKLIAVARHIAKTLGHNESMADDILQIFSNFDGRFSREKLSDKMTGDHDLRACASLDHTLESLERQISQYVAADHPIWSDSADSSAFLDSVDELIATIRYWAPMATSDKTVSACLARAEDFMQQAMFRLGEEFRLLIERGCETFDLMPSYVNNGESTMFDSDEEEEMIDGGEDHNEIPVAQPLTDYDVVIDALPSGTINDLHEIAKRMVAGGFGKECSHVYSSCRREFLEESMSRLGVQKLSIEEVQKMVWQDLEDEINKWIKASNVALRILFPSERRLCDRVFFGFSSAADLSFMEVCRVSTVQILNFADAVAIGSRSPERLFKILDLFETLRDLMPEFESNFSDQYSLVLRNDGVLVWKRLGETIRGIFMELENLIRRDPAKAPVPRGGLHPITRYVMNYVRAACRSRETLEQVFEENVNVVVPSKDSSTSLSVQISWIMELLESNLEMKSKIYGDAALCSVFMMNNERYILQKVKDSDELGSLLGDDWIRKHTAKIKQFQMSYQRSSWNKILGLLKVDVGNAAGRPLSMKDKIKLFKSQFEDTCKIQSQWIIFDDQLRKELKISLANLLLPAYQNFIKRFQNSPEVGKHADKYINYGVEDIEMHINELFQGVGGSAVSRK